METKCISKTLFVGNLHASLEETDLLEIFRPYGRIVECCKRWCHYGFIQFATEEEARLAFNNLNGSKVRGRPMRIEFQRKKLRSLHALLEAGMDAGKLAYPFQMGGSFGELDELRSLLGYQQSNGYSTSSLNFAGLDSFDINNSSSNSLLASALQSKKLAEAKNSQYFAGSCDNLASFGQQFVQPLTNPYSSKCYYRPAEPDVKSFFPLPSPSSSLSSSNSSSSCYQSNMAIIFDELIGDSYAKPLQTGGFHHNVAAMSSQSNSQLHQLTLNLSKNATDRTVLSANINHANIQHQSKPAAEAESVDKKTPESNEEHEAAASCDDPTDLLNALLDKALLSIYDDDEISCEELLISAAFDNEHESNQKVNEGHKVANTVRSNGTSPAFSPTSSTGTGPSRAVPSPSKSVGGSNPHSAPYRSRQDSTAAADSNPLMLYRSVNTSNTIFVQPTDVLEPLNEGEFTEYKLFPSAKDTGIRSSSAKPPSSTTLNNTGRPSASWSSVKHSKSCLSDMELLVIDYTPPFSVSLSPNTSSSSSCSNVSSLLTSPSSSSPSLAKDKKSPYLRSNPYSSSHLATIF